MKHLVTFKHISEFANSEEYLEYIKSLRRETEANPMSKSVPDIKIIFGAKTIVKFERENKTLTMPEVELLAAEYAQTVDVLVALFKKRKIAVLDAAGVNINARKPRVAKGPRKARRKKDADAVEDAGRPDAVRDQLQQPGPSDEVLAEEPICPGPQVTD